MSDDLQRRIDILESREAIKEAAAAYAHGIIGGGEGVAALFTDDGVFRIDDANLKIEGREALDAFYGRMQVGTSYPFTCDHIINIDGDDATLVCSMDNPAHDEGRKGYCGIYHDTMRRVNGKWLFAERSFIFLQGRGKLS